MANERDLERWRLADPDWDEAGPIEDEDEAQWRYEEECDRADREIKRRKEEAWY